MFPKLKPTQLWLQASAGIAIALLACQIILAIVLEIDESAFYQLLAVMAIIVALQTLVIPIFARMNTVEVKTAHTLILQLGDDGTYRDTAGQAYSVNALGEESD